MIFTLRDEVEIYHTVMCCVLLVLSLHITLSLHWYYDGVTACLCQVQLLRTNLCVCRVPGSTRHTPPLVGPSQHNFYGQKAGWGCSALAGWSRTDAVDVSLGYSGVTVEQLGITLTTAAAGAGGGCWAACTDSQLPDGSPDMRPGVLK